MFDSVDELLASHASAGGRGTDEQDVRKAESVIGNFPSDYRLFLLEYGWLSIEHLEIFGLGDDAPEYLNVVRMTQLERAEPASPLPSSFVSVMNDGAGNLLCFDSSEISSSGTSRIYLWDHELGQNQRPEALADSFESWLTRLLEVEL